MFAYGILKVIYAPRKAFKEIIENPKYIGPILIMILFIAANIGSMYTVISKTYVERTLPEAEQLDLWTEDSTLWETVPGAVLGNNYDDYIDGAYYGNKSIESTIANEKQMMMQLNDFGPVNCSGPDGYKSLYLRMKWTSPEVKPRNVTILLFSVIPSDYFYYNSTEEFSNITSNIWNNLTIPLESEIWLRKGVNANWNNINGLKLEFAWPENANITLLVDGLFFGGVFKSPVENAVNYLFNISVSAFMQFTIKWVLLGGLLYIMTKAFGSKAVWKPLLISTGFALITLFIQAMINVVAFATLPTLYYPLELIGGVKGESETAFNKILEETRLVSQTTGYLQIGIYIWTIALCAIATRLLTEFSWNKSFLVSLVSYFVSMLVANFIFGL